MKCLSWFVVASAIALVPAGTVKADPPMAAYTTYNVKCVGSNNVCYTIQGPQGPINQAGDFVEIEEIEVRRNCTPQESESTAIFLHTPGNPGQGTGYAAAKVCANGNEGTAQVEIDDNTMTYTNFGDWLNATTLH
jgi:hypothetical protein